MLVRELIAAAAMVPAGVRVLVAIPGQTPRSAVGAAGISYDGCALVLELDSDALDGGPASLAQRCQELRDFRRSGSLGAGALAGFANSLAHEGCDMAYTQALTLTVQDALMASISGRSLNDLLPRAWTHDDSDAELTMAVSRLAPLIGQSSRLPAPQHLAAVVCVGLLTQLLGSLSLEPRAAAEAA